MLKLKFFFFLLFPILCQATDLKPWFGKEYEAEVRASLLYQNYSSVASRHCNDYDRSANDLFLDLSIAYPFKRYCGEFEAVVAHTRHQNCRWDNFRFTGRVQALDEEEGDCVTMTGGITVIQAFSRALHDISSFHHGHLEGEFTLSVGQRFGMTNCIPYQYRWWNVFGIGAADVGVPWLRDYLAVEYLSEGRHHFRTFIEILWGTGGENLRRNCFDGYGFIRHRSVDCGCRYGYDLGCWGTLSLQYARRLYAFNFPEKANLVLLEYYLPFGTQFTCSY
jgi:hypothetical protein